MYVFMHMHLCMVGAVSLRYTGRNGVARSKGKCMYGLAEYCQFRLPILHSHEHVWECLFAHSLANKVDYQAFEFLPV